MKVGSLATPLVALSVLGLASCGADLLLVKANKKLAKISLPNVGDPLTKMNLRLAVLELKNAKSKRQIEGEQIKRVEGLLKDPKLKINPYNVTADPLANKNIRTVRDTLYATQHAAGSVANKDRNYWNEKVKIMQQALHDYRDGSSSSSSAGGSTASLVSRFEQARQDPVPIRPFNPGNEMRGSVSGRRSVFEQQPQASLYPPVKENSRLYGGAEARGQPTLYPKLDSESLSFEQNAHNDPGDFAGYIPREQGHLSIDGYHPQNTKDWLPAGLSEQPETETMQRMEEEQVKGGWWSRMTAAPKRAAAAVGRSVNRVGQGIHHAASSTARNIKQAASSTARGLKWLLFSPVRVIIRMNPWMQGRSKSEQARLASEIAAYEQEAAQRGETIVTFDSETILRHAAALRTNCAGLPAMIEQAAELNNPYALDQFLLDTTGLPCLQNEDTLGSVVPSLMAKGHSDYIGRILNSLKGNEGIDYAAVQLTLSLQKMSSEHVLTLYHALLRSDNNKIQAVGHFLDTVVREPKLLGLGAPYLWVAVAKMNEAFEVTTPALILQRNMIHGNKQLTQDDLRVIDKYEQLLPSANGKNPFVTVLQKNNVTPSQLVTAETPRLFNVLPLAKRINELLSQAFFHPISTAMVLRNNPPSLEALKKLKGSLTNPGSRLVAKYYKKTFGRPFTNFCDSSHRDPNMVELQVSPKIVGRFDELPPWEREDTAKGILAVLAKQHPDFFEMQPPGTVLFHLTFVQQMNHRIAQYCAAKNSKQAVVLKVEDLD